MPDSKTSLLYLFGATFATAILGDAASDIARWIVCAASEDACVKEARKAAEMLATMVSTYFACALAALAGMRGKTTHLEATSLIVGAMVGAFFAILKTVEGDGNYPVLDGEIVGPLIIYSVGLCVIIGPLAYVRLADRVSPETGMAILARAAVSLLLACAVGIVFQWSADFLWQVEKDNLSSTKFVLSPAAPLIATATFGALMLPPVPWGRPGVLVLLTLAISAASIYTFFDYLPTHTVSNGWISRGGNKSLSVGIAYSTVLLSGIFGMAILSTYSRPIWPRLFLLAVLVGAAALAFYAGHRLGIARYQAFSGLLSKGNGPVIGAVQAVATILGIITAFAGRALTSRLAK